MAVTLNVPTNLNLQINANSFSQPLGKITGNVKDFDAALAASNARVIAFGASTAVLGTAIRGFKELADATIEVEKNLTDINRVLGLSTNQLQKYSSQLFEVTKQTSSSFAEASKAALEFSRQGIKAEETLIRTKDALTLTRLAGVSTQDAVEALTATVNNFTKENLNSSIVLNKLVAVEQSFSVSAGDLSEALTRTGQAASEANVSFDQLNALVTTAQQTTARGGAVIGNALKSIFTRLQRSETLDQLEAYNIAVRDVEGNTLPAVNILQNFAQSYKTLASSQRAQLSEQVAGVYQVNILKSLVNDLNSSNSVYASSLKKGADATNEADAATAQLNQTLSSLLSQTSTASTQLAANIGKVTFEPLAKSAAGTAKSVIEAFNDILQGEGVGSDFANGFLKGIRNLLAGPGAIAAFYTLFKLVQTSFTYVAQVLPQIAGITTETQNRKNIEAAILQIMQSQNPISQELAINTGNQAAQANILLNLAKAQTAQYELQAQLAQKLSVSLSSSGVNVGNRGLGVKSSGGYIPQSDKMAEAIGARAGGYTPGQIVNSPVGGVMNTAESVKYVPGFAQPFINPPANSQAGQAHRQNSIARTGVDPYASGGFVPNFVKKQEDRIAMAKRLRGFDPSFFEIHGPNQTAFARDRGESFQKYENRALDENGIIKFVKSSNYLAYKKSSSIDGYKVEGDKISLAEVKSDDESGFKPCTLEDVKQKFLRGIAENYNTGKQNQLSQALEKFIASDPSSNNKKDIYGYLFAPPLVLERKGPQAEAVSSGGFIPNFATLQEYLSDKGILRLKGPSANAAHSFGVPIQDIRDNLGDQNWTPKSATANEALAREQAKEAAIERRGYLTRDIPFIDASNNKRIVSSDPRYKTSTEFGDAYEKYAADILRSKYPDILSNIQAGLYGGRNAAIDALSSEKNTLFEMKGGQVDNAEVQDKFRRVYTENKKNKYFNPPKNWMQILIRNAAAGFIPNFAGLTKLSRFESSELNKGSIFTESLGSSAVKYTGNKEKLIADIQASIGRILTDGEKRFLMFASDGKLSQLSDPNILARFINSESKGGFAGFSKGFIPNFAYQQGVMQLEEGMSGNKAVFDTNPFPHVRNSGQPSFESAIADHGGLNQALSDSLGNQKMAGLMNKGFVPNFADFDITGTSLSTAKGQAVSHEKINEAINNYIKSIDLSATGNQQISDYLKKTLLPAFKLNAESFNEVRRAALDHAKAERTAAQAAAQQKIEERQKSSFLANAAFARGGESSFNKVKGIEDKIGNLTNNFGFQMAAPIIGGLAEQFVTQGKSREELSYGQRFAGSAASSVATGISTGAAIGSAIPVVGTAVGAAVGGLTGLGLAAYNSKDSLEDMTKRLQNQKIKDEEIAQAAQGVIDTFDLIKKLDPKSLEGQDSAAKLNEYFLKLQGSELDQAFKALTDDTKNLNKILGEFSFKTRQKNTADAEIIESKKRDSLSLYDIEKQNILEVRKGLSRRNQRVFNVGTGKYEDQPYFVDDIKRITPKKENFQKIILQNNVFFENLRKIQDALGDDADDFNKNIKNPEKIKELLGDRKFQGVDVEAFLKELETLQSSTGEYTQFFYNNLQKISKYLFDKELKTLTQAVETKAAEGFNSRALIEKLDDSIKDYVFKTALQIQELEFDSSRLGVLQSAANEFLDKFIGPSAASLSEISTKKQKLSNSQEQERIGFSSNVSENVGKKLSDLLGGGNKDILQDKIKPLLDEMQTFKGATKVLESLKESTSSIKKAKEAGFIVKDDKALKALNQEIDKLFEKSGELSNRFRLQNEQEGLEVDTMKRRASLAQNLLNITTKLIDVEAERTMMLDSQTTTREIQNIREKSATERPGFGFNSSPTEIQNRKNTVEKAALERNQTTQQEALFKDSGPILQGRLDMTKANLTQALYQSPNIDVFSGIYQVLNSIDEINTTNITSFGDYLDVLDKIKTALEPLKEGNKDIYETTVKEIVAARKLTNEQEKQNVSFVEGAGTLNQTARIQTALNRLYIDRISLILKSQAAEEEATNAADIKLQKLETYQNRAANFYGLGISGKAESQIDYNNKKLEQNQKKLEIQNTKQVRSNIEEFKKYQTELNNFTGPLSPTQTSVLGVDTDIKNTTDAKRLADDLARVGSNMTAGSEDRKKLADLEKQIRSILQSQTSELEKQRGVQDIINESVKQEAIDRKSFKVGLQGGFDQMKTESEETLNKIGKEAPILFRDGLVDGIKAAIAESHHLGDALMKIGGNFLNEISTQLMKGAVGNILGSMGIDKLFTGQAGGVIHAQNGMFVSGTGSGDKYPAMLENGEYVLNRNAVATLGGPSALDSFNFRAAPRFATGGATNFELTNLNRIRQPYQLSAIPELESQMTTYGAENSVEYNRLRDEARTIAADQRQKKLQRQSQMAALIGSVVAGVASIGISKGLNYKPQGSYNSSTAGKLEMATSGQGGSEEMMTLHKQSGGSIGSRLSDTIPHFMNGGMLDSPIVQKYGTRMQSGGSSLLASGGNSSTVNNNNSNTSNAFNFAVNVDRTGKIDLGKNQTSYEQKDVEFSKNMSTELYGAVLKVIANERRFGGSLAGLKNK